MFFGIKSNACYRHITVFPYTQALLKAYILYPFISLYTVFQRLKTLIFIQLFEINFRSFSSQKIRSFAPDKETGRV